MGFDEVTACWQQIREAPLDALGTILPAHADALELNGEPGPTLLVGEGEPTALVLVANDEEGRVWVLLVPVDRIDAPLAAALATLDGHTFTTPADLDEPACNAAALVLSAIGLDRDSGEAMAAWARECGATAPTDAITGYYERFDGCVVRSWDQLARHVSTVCRWRRTM